MNVNADDPAAQAAVALDEFSDLAAWQAIAPGATRLALAPDRGPQGGAMRLDFDLGAGGFVIARRPCALELPESYAFDFMVRGEGTQHVIEFKLIDADGHTVWRHRDEQFALASPWRPWCIDCSQIEFAWGPRRTPRLERAATLEIALVGAGSGRLWLAQFGWRDTGYRKIPRVTASSSAAGCTPDAILAADAAGWCSEEGAQHWLQIDFGCVRRLSAALIAWHEQRIPHTCTLAASDDGVSWRALRTLTGGLGRTSRLLLPGLAARLLRLELAGDRSGCGIAHLGFAPWDFARDRAAGVSALAALAPRGHYPKALTHQQSYWTVSAAAAGSAALLLNTEGMIEADHAAYTIEPFVRIDGRLYSWAAVDLQAQLHDDHLPIPSVRWQTTEFTLEIILAVVDGADHACAIVEYRLHNRSTQERRAELYLALRPFQVTPAWQQWQNYGGLAPLTTLSWHDGAVHINHTRRLVPLDAVADFGVTTLAAAELIEALASGALPAATAIDSAEGDATGALRFAFALAAGATRVLRCAVPAAAAAVTTTLADPIATAAAAWRAALGDCVVDVPPPARELWLTLRSAAAHILVNRDGPRLQPGPRRYTRAYLRDGVVMGAALARLGRPEPLRDFLRWFAAFQQADGSLPDCVDDRGAEWLPEYDAYGEFIFGVAEVERLHPDPAFLAALWPPVERAVARLERLRDERLTAAYRAPALASRYGLLPESMSHEGYMAYPVHAYWDDFWALRGWRDAAFLAGRCGAAAASARLTALAATFAIDVRTSLARTVAEHGIGFMPGAVELGDFDPTASAIALTIADESAALPRALLDATFDRYLAAVAARAHDQQWANYSAYEIRIVGALVRLGRRTDALAITRTLLADCRPPAWRQWPEQSWRDYDAPAFLGDLPHSWIGAEYILATLSLFAFEHGPHQTLTLAAGLDPAWLDAGAPVGVRNLSTHYGGLGFRVQRLDAATISVVIDAGLRVPPGGIVLAPPLAGPLRAATVNGTSWHEFDALTCVCRTVPATVVMRC